MYLFVPLRKEHAPIRIKVVSFVCYSLYIYYLYLFKKNKEKLTLNSWSDLSVELLSLSDDELANLPSLLFRKISYFYDYFDRKIFFSIIWLDIFILMLT